MPNVNQKQLITAFLHFENSVKATFKAEVDSISFLPAGRRYVESIRGYVTETGLECEVPEYDFYDDDEFRHVFEEFRIYMRRYIAQLQARLMLINEGLSDDVDEQEFLRISPDYKIEIHNKLNQIRKIILVAELTVDNRDFIFGKISALGLAVDRDRTPLGTVMSNILDISNTAGQATKNAEPLLKKIESLFKVFSGAKAQSEQLMLETDEVKSLPTPDTE